MKYLPGCHVTSARMPESYLVVGGVMAIFFVFMGLYLLRELWRQKGYRAFCEARGYTYQVGSSDTCQTYAPIADVFSKGRPLGRSHLISGQFNGHPFVTFEYQYAIGSGRAQRLGFVAVVHWEKAGADLPQFDLRPRGLLDAVGLGGSAIAFPEDRPFSDACAVIGPDEPAIRSLFTSEVRAALVPNLGQHLAGKGKDLFWWKEGNLPDADELEAYLRDVDRIRNLFLSDSAWPAAA